MTVGALKSRVFVFRGQYEPQWRHRRQMIVLLLLFGATVVVGAVVLASVVAAAAAGARHRSRRAGLGAHPHRDGDRRRPRNSGAAATAAEAGRAANTALMAFQSL